MTASNGQNGHYSAPMSADVSHEQILPLRTAISAVRSRWWLILSVMCAVIAVVMWRTNLKQYQYVATATVQVGDGRTQVAGIVQQPTNWRVDPMVSEQQIIKSQPVGQRVAEMLGLQLNILSPQDVNRTDVFGSIAPSVDSGLVGATFALRFTDASYSLLQNGRALATAPYGKPMDAGGLHFTVPARPTKSDRQILLNVIPSAKAGAAVIGGVVTRSLPSTDIIAIEYRGSDPVLVMNVANALARAYAEFSIQNRRNMARQRTVATHLAIDEQKQRLSDAQSAVKAFKEREQISSVPAEQGALISSIHSIEAKRDAVLTEQRVYKNLIGRLAATDTSSDDLRRLAGTEAVNNTGYMSTLYQRWHDLSRRREEMLAKYKPWNRDVKAVDALIGQVKDELRDASGLYVRALQSNVDGLESTIASLRSKLERYPKLEEEESQLESAVHTSQSIYEKLETEYQTAKIGEATLEPQIRVIDPAPQPTTPVYPNKRRNFFTALVFGLCLGLGAAIALENLDDSVKSPDEVREGFGVAVLGTIPRIGANVGGHRDRPEAEGRLVTHLDPRSPVAEAYRSLRTNLSFARANTAMRTMVLTSPGPSDGKSTTVANLAITFAQQGQRTLLIDADLRRAVLDKVFKVPRAPGLTDVLVGQKKLIEVVRQTHIANLSVIGSGQFPPNPAELLGSAAMREALREATEHFDIVLLDSPPLLAVTDAAVLATMVDGAILVVRVGSTAKTAVRRAAAQLQNVAGRVIGAVLNDVDFRSAAFGGTYGYYYYYYYGQEAGRGPKSNRLLDRVLRRQPQEPKDVER
ncbi:MAG: polysaccharide biosynthesis tyrosine autokinase [Gemmatimonadota bacterium]|nr:polysaccharide biosynthesis tyrosine autokinase [Gemmatimonadota bacterium]